VTTRIVLVRHGHVPGIDPERFRGGTNLELTERGVREAQLTAIRIARHWRPAIVYTSTRKRCLDTGRFIADACGVSSRTLAAIHDFDYGSWTERTHEDVRTSFPEEYRRWRTQPQTVRFPDGDSLQDLAAHAADALRLIVDAHADATVVVVGHDSSNRSLLLHALGLPLSAYWRITQSPCGISEFVVDAEATVVVRLNETAHIDGIEMPA
jgi:phosphoserine phosphatase